MHFLDIAGGIDNGTELQLQQMGVGKAAADATQAEEGIVFGGQLQIWQRLVSSHIHCPDGKHLALACKKSVTVLLPLLLASRHGVPLKEQEFRAEQAHAVGSCGHAPEHVFYIAGIDIKLAAGGPHLGGDGAGSVHHRVVNPHCVARGYALNVHANLNRNPFGMGDYAHVAGTAAPGAENTGKPPEVNGRSI